MKTKIMGILNVTPDSFSDGGKYNAVDKALKHCEEMIHQGATIIDVGGESTRHGYEKISVQEEIDRVVPVIEKIRDSFDTTISIDTYKAPVASAAVKAGADIINDIWGLRYDDDMASVVVNTQAEYIMMHNRPEQNPDWTMSDFMDMFNEDINYALSKGISMNKIIYDPGIGFAKTQDQNVEILAHLDDMRKLDIPVLLGASRKSVIDYVCDLPVEARLEGTLATTAAAVLGGCEYVRVHDVRENYRFIQMFEAILQARK
ncbi:MAG: dihydropteroate synthase [Lachnospiraceae bacterium]|nr:dihydropteroate synthase [Lachnospiraceae bacterium]